MSMFPSRSEPIMDIEEGVTTNVIHGKSNTVANDGRLTVSPDIDGKILLILKISLAVLLGDLEPVFSFLG